MFLFLIIRPLFDLESKGISIHVEHVNNNLFFLIKVTSSLFELQSKKVRSDLQKLKKFNVLYDSLKQKSIS